MNLILERLGLQGVVIGLLEFAIIIAFGYLFYLFRKTARQSQSPIHRYLSFGFFFAFLNMLAPTLITFSSAFWLNENNLEIFDLLHNILYFSLEFFSLFCFIKAANAGYKNS